MELDGFIMLKGKRIIQTNKQTKCLHKTQAHVLVHSHHGALVVLQSNTINYPAYLKATFSG